MLPLLNIEELNDHLLKLHQIIETYENHDSSFSEWAKFWLQQAEKILINNRLPAAGPIATLRGMVISSERGVVSNEIIFINASNVRKARDAVAAEALRRAEVLITDLLRNELENIQEAKQILQQVVAVARYKRYLDTQNMLHGDFVKYVWECVSADHDLAQGTVKVTALVGIPNALALLSQLLPYYDQSYVVS